MKKAPLLLGFALASAISVPAMAMEDSPTAGHGSAAALLGWGFKDPAQFGIGLRGGYTFPVNVYVGGTFVYHLGKSQSIPGGGDFSANMYYIGVEGGYDIAAGPVVVRPYLGLGPAFVHASVPSVSFGGITASGGSDTETRFGVWPGVVGLYPIDNFFVGLDMRVVIVSEATAFSLFATGGMQF
jgi:hypothetical protein